MSQNSLQAAIAAMYELQASGVATPEQAQEHIKEAIEAFCGKGSSSGHVSKQCASSRTLSAVYPCSSPRSASGALPPPPPPLTRGAVAASSVRAAPARADRYPCEVAATIAAAVAERLRGRLTRISGPSAASAQSAQRRGVVQRLKDYLSLVLVLADFPDSGDMRHRVATIAPEAIEDSARMALVGALLRYPGAQLGPEVKAATAHPPRGTTKVVKMGEVFLAMKAVAHAADARRYFGEEPYLEFVSPPLSEHVWSLHTTLHPNLLPIYDVITPWSLLGEEDSAVDAAESGSDEDEEEDDMELYSVFFQHVFVCVRAYLPECKTLRDYLPHWGTAKSRHYPRRCDALQLMNVAHQIASGLSALHREGRAHGNLKPSNILVGSPGEDGQRRVYLADYGLPLFPCCYLQEVGATARDGHRYVRLVWAQPAAGGGSAAISTTPQKSTASSLGGSSDGSSYLLPEVTEPQELHLLLCLAAPEAVSVEESAHAASQRRAAGMEVSPLSVPVWVREDLLHTPAADAYALGVVLFAALCHRYPPQPVYAEMRLSTRFGFGVVPRERRDVAAQHVERLEAALGGVEDGALGSIVVGLLHPDPNQRLLITELLEDPLVLRHKDDRPLRRAGGHSTVMARAVASVGAIPQWRAPPVSLSTASVTRLDRRSGERSSLLPRRPSMPRWK